MKRIGHLLPAIAERGNLALAFWKAAKGRRQSALVRRFAADLDRQLAALGEEIRDGSVPVDRYVRFVVFDPKERVIHAAPFRQRVLHHAIMNLCGQIFERGAIDQSYACRLGMGNTAALAQARRCSRAGGWFLKMDVRRFFDSVDHGILKARFRRLFRDPGLLRLLDRIVDGYSTVDGKGLPIGALTSQYFANFYLDAFDRFVKEHLRCRHYVRFMDDFALWHDSRTRLEEWRDAVTDWLWNRLRLEIKPGTRLLPTSEGMPFLGFRVLPARLLLGRRARRRFAARLVALETAWQRGEIGDEALQRRAGALVAFTQQADCLAWRRNVVRRRSRIDEELPQP